jgi:hypothetical protein
VLANTNTAGGGSGSNSVVINNGALVVTNTAGSLAVAINRVAVTNATLQFCVTNGRVNLRATNLFTGGNSNVINVVSLPVIGTFPVQFQLIKYASGIAGAGYNFTLGAMPAGRVVYGGYLSNNTAGLSVDLVLTSFTPVQPRFVDARLNGTNFTLAGINGVANWPYVVLTATNPAQPLSQWQKLATNFFDSAGNFSFTDSANVPRAFYRLQFQ